MKKLICLLLLISFCSAAQKKVYQAGDFEKEIMSMAEMRKQYHALSIIQPNDTKNMVVLTEVAVKKLSSDFQLMALKKGVPFHTYDESRSIPVELLIQPNGSIDYFKYGYQGYPGVRRNPMMNDSLNAENTRKLTTLADEFCRTYKLPANISKEKFSLNFLLTIGPVPKKPSKMYIWNVEMAEACDKPDTVKTLILNNLYLTSFPQVVFRFRNLEKLDLANNFIEKIPAAVSGIARLKFLSITNNPINNNKLKFRKNTHLKDLNIQFTGIRMIPRSISRNRSLEILFLGNNRFDRFRKRDFRKMDNLRALNLYNAGLTEVPANVLKLKKLDELDLYYNELKKLPDAICEMPMLKTLAVSNNDLWNLPASLYKLKTLETLYAHHNRLTNLPALPDLKLLHLGHNLFAVFPEQVYQLNNLVEFDIAQNQLREVPGELRKLEKLQRLFIEGNDFSKMASKKEELTKLVTDLEKKDILVR